jgi:hypothetical protein
VSLALVAGLAIAALPAAASVRTSRPAVSPRAIRAFWTPRRMRAALPAAPTPGAARDRPAKRGRHGSLHQPVLHPSRGKLRTHGKVFFSALAHQFQCSATSVRAPSRSLVITAGHCAYFHSALMPSQNAVSHWEFVPAYRDGHAPFGEWPGTTTATPEWRSSNPQLGPTGDVGGGDLRFDVGAGTVARTGGKTLASVVGARPIAFNRARRHGYRAIGYPAAPPFDGTREFSCRSPYRGADLTNGRPAALSISCDMTAGASGGGWVDRRGRLESVTSYEYDDKPNRIFGPYFGSAVKRFYDSVKRG